MVRPLKLLLKRLILILQISCVKLRQKNDLCPRRVRAADDIHKLVRNCQAGRRGAEPTKIAREDGTYVVLGYDAAKPRQAGQWTAIIGYAQNHSYSRSALFISLYKMRAPRRVKMIKKRAAAGVLIIPMSILSEAR